MNKQFLSFRCGVCGCALWFTGKIKNYRYVVKGKKGFYLCTRCKYKDLKNKGAD